MMERGIEMPKIRANLLSACSEVDSEAWYPTDVANFVKTVPVGMRFAEFISFYASAEFE